MKSTDSTESRLLAAIAAQETLRGTLDEGLIEATIAALRAQLQTVRAASAPAPAAVDTRRRRQVSVLFADLPAFAGLAQTLDAEEVSRLLNQVWQQVDGVIERFGGQIDKHIGQAVMALWGVEQAREDDAERAVRAGLELSPLLHNLAAELSDELSRRGLSDYPLRIGVHTGPVILGAVGMNAEFTAIGDTVNTASRLQHAAQEGELLISQETYDLVRGLFELEPRVPLNVKGKSGPLQTYLVQRSIPRRFRMQRRGVEGISTRMVGREAELFMLQAAYRRAAEGRQMQSALLVAEGGIGKSRLVDEFEGWLNTLPAPWQQAAGDGAGLLRARAEEGAQSLPYALLRDLFTNHCQIQESDSQAQARLKLDAAFMMNLAQSGPAAASEAAALVGQLLGFDYSGNPYLQAILNDAAQIRQLAYHKAADYLRRLVQRAAPAPLVLLLDDLHWADDGSLDFLKFLGLELGAQPLMLLAAARPAFFEQHAEWNSEELWPNLLRLDLRPLSSEASRQLTTQILQRLPDIPHALLRTIVENAEGNPYYLEELIKMLIEQGVIIKGDNRWRVESGRLRQLDIPPSLTGILQARLDRLPAAEDEALQRAAVIGRTFWDAAVVALAAGGEQTHQALQVLGDRELIYRQDDSIFQSTTEFVFKHAILREVTYQRVLKARRREYHRQAAEWLITQAGDRSVEHAGQIAAHYEHANALQPAAEWYTRAGQQAYHAYLPQRAQEYFERALSLLGGTPEDPLAGEAAAPALLPVLSGLAEVYQDLGCGSEAYLMLEAAVQTAELAGNGPEQVRLLDLRSLQWMGSGDMLTSEALLEEAITLARSLQPPNPGLLGQVIWRRGTLHLRQGQYAQGVERVTEALALAEQAGERGLRASCFNILGLNALHHSRHRQALEWMLQSRQIWHELGHRRFEAALASNIGEIYRLTGDYARSAHCYEEAIEISQQIDSHEFESTAQSNLAAALLQLGRLPEALQHLALADQLAPDHRYRQSEAERFRAEVYLRLGDLPMAHLSAQKALGLCRQIGEAERLLHSWRVLGNLAAQLTLPLQLDPALAAHPGGGRAWLPEECYQMALSFSTGETLALDRIVLLADYARYAAAQGQAEKAAALRREALDLVAKLDVPELGTVVSG